MSDLYNVSYAPHKKGPYTTKKIMQDVVIALIPAGLFSIYNFGLRALLIILLSIVTCVLSEYLFLKIRKEEIPPSDYSEVVTGLLLAYSLPVNVPLWLPVMGGFFAIIVIKMLYGGLGKNIMNPALGGRSFLLISFPALMTSFTVEKFGNGQGFLSKIYSGSLALDGVTSATPLQVIKDGGQVDHYKMFIGNINGSIGEVSSLAILIGALFLLYRGIIKLRIPLTYLLSFSLFFILFAAKPVNLSFLLSHLLGGGLILGAFFMATDYTSSPISPSGQIIFGILLGLLTAIFRVYGTATEGVAYSIILANLIKPLIDRVTIPKPFGKEKLRNEKR